MGYWGSLVLARTDDSLLEVEPVAERSEGLIDEDRFGQWVLGQFEDTEHYDDAPGLLPELARATGAPCLVGFIMDSDAIAISAYSPQSGFFQAALAPGSMRGYYEDYDATFPPPDHAARHAATWARHAGLVPDITALNAVFNEEPELFVEPLLPKLLAALGIHP